MRYKWTPPKDNVRLTRSIGDNHTGFVINKTNRVVQYESFQEHTFILMLERNKEVIDFISQPETIELQSANNVWDATNEKYTVDFKAFYKDGSIVMHEITVEDRRDKPNAKFREAEAARVFKERGWGYQIHTPETLPGVTETENLFSLHRYKPECYLDPLVAQGVAELAKAVKALPLDELAVKLVWQTEQPLPVVVNTLGHLIWHESLSANIDKHLFFYDGMLNGRIAVSLASFTER